MSIYGGSLGRKYGSTTDLELEVLRRLMAPVTSHQETAATPLNRTLEIAGITVTIPQWETPVMPWPRANTWVEEGSSFLPDKKGNHIYRISFLEVTPGIADRIVETLKNGKSQDEIDIFAEIRTSARLKSHPLLIGQSYNPLIVKNKSDDTRLRNHLNKSGSPLINKFIRKMSEENYLGSIPEIHKHIGITFKTLVNPKSVASKSFRTMIEQMHQWHEIPLLNSL